MPIDDELEKSEAAIEIAAEAQRSVQEILMRSGMAGALSLLPFGIGKSITEALTELAFKRVYERMDEMFRTWGRRLGEVEEEKINRDWFKTEQFQTLLFEALHQLHATHDREKIAMLGTALANSGLKEFEAEERKELFVRLVRELAPQHVSALLKLLPRPARIPDPLPPGLSRQSFESAVWRGRPSVSASGDGLMIFQMLASNGLVEERLHPVVKEPSVSSFATVDDAKRAVKDLLQSLRTPPRRTFSLSELGRDFLRFVGQRTAADPDSGVPQQAKEQPIDRRTE